jgi:hypothetical protein
LHQVSSSPPDTSKLPREQVESVLRRAAELDARRELQRAGATSEEVGVDELVRMGEEAGLRSETVMRALAELRGAALAAPADDDGLGRALGPNRLVVSREVPGPSAPVQRAVERFLREQLMTIRRHHGERVEWERAQGLWPGLARSLDFARRYAFAPVGRVDTVVVPAAGDEATSVTFQIDLTESRRHRLRKLVLRASAAFAAVGLGGAALFPGFGVNDVLALFSGGAIAGGLFALEKRRFQEARERIALAPERFLDLLVQRRRRALEAAAPDTQAEDAAD